MSTTTTTATTTKARRRRPAGPILALLLVAVLAAGCMPADAKTFLDRTNSLRSSQGIRPLKEHDTLTRKAEAWAQQMARTGRLSHSNLTDGLSGVRWRSLGENVGYSSPTSDTLKSIHDMFVRSAGHRANLVNPAFTHMGVGVATDSRGRIWVAQVFARI